MFFFFQLALIEDNRMNEANKCFYKIKCVKRVAHRA